MTTLDPISATPAGTPITTSTAATLTYPMTSSEFLRRGAKMKALDLDAARANAAALDAADAAAAARDVALGRK